MVGCAEGCGDMAGGVGGCRGDMAGSVGGCCGDMAGGIGDMIGSVGGCKFGGIRIDG